MRHFTPMNYLGFPLVDNANTVRIAVFVRIPYDATKHSNSSVTVFHVENDDTPNQTTLGTLFAANTFNRHDESLRARQDLPNGTRLALQILGSRIESTVSLGGDSAGLAIEIATTHQLQSKLDVSEPTRRIWLVSVPVVPSRPPSPETLRSLGGGAALKKTHTLAYLDHPVMLLLHPDDCDKESPLLGATVARVAIHSLPIESNTTAANLARKLGTLMQLRPLDSPVSPPTTQQNFLGQPPMSDTNLLPNSGEMEPLETKTLRQLFMYALINAPVDKDRLKACFNDSYFDSKLLEIQKEAATHGDIFESKQHVMVTGPTGCGKSALLDAFILRSIIVEQKPVIYLAPVRALAAQFQRKFLARYSNLLRVARDDYQGAIDKKIVISSGDYLTHDRDVLAGRTWLACMVTEKANVFMSDPDQGRQFLQSLDLVIIDEMHMISDEARGGVVDQLLTKIGYWQSVCKLNEDKEGAPKVVAVTTEELDKHVRQSQLLKDFDGKYVLPINGFLRPVAMDHYWIIRAPGPSVLRAHQFIPQQKNSDQLQLSAVARAKIQQSVSTAINQACGAIEGVNSAYPSNFYCEFLTKQIPAHFKRVALAKGSRMALEGIAAQICNSTGIVQLPENWSSSFAEKLRASGMNEDQITLQTKWGAAGIFLHTSEQPLAVREHVEVLFEGEVPAGGDRLYLLTTETLSYGINLSLDCVVVGGVEFPRSVDPVLLQHEPTKATVDRPMRRNAFRNLIGRAGRKGLNPYAAVYIELATVSKKSDVVDRPKPADIEAHLRRYYTNEPESGAPFISGLFQRFDFVTLTTNENRNNRLTADDKPTYLGFADFSYASLRAVLDAVSFRTTGNLGPTERELRTYLADNSPFYAFHCGAYQLTNDRPPADEKIYGQANQIVSLILESCSKSGINSLLAKDSSNGRFTITNCGVALISTGTTPTSIATIGDWLIAMTNWSTDAGIQPADIACEALVPGLVMSPDFWASAASDFCQEHNLRDEPAPQNPDVILSRSSDLLCAELRAMDVSEKDASAFVVAVIKFVDEQRSKTLWAYQVKNSIIAKSISIKLCAVVLAWVRGGDISVIRSYYGSKNVITDGAKGPKIFASKHADRLGWLTRATSLFYDKTVELRRLSGLRAELIQFSARLVKGLPIDVLPLAERVGPNPAHRTAIMRDRLLTLTGKLAGGYTKPLDAFFSRQLLSLFDGLSRGLSDSLNNQQRRELRDSFEQVFTDNFAKQRVDLACTSIWNNTAKFLRVLQTLDAGKSGFEAIREDENGLVLVFKASSMMMTIAQPTFTTVQAELKTKDGAPIRVEATAKITLFALLALGVLCHRELIEFEDCVALFKKQAARGQPLRVRDLALHAGNDDFEKAGSLRDDLLGIFDFEWDGK